MADGVNYNPSTNTGKVRMYTNDRDRPYFLSDTEIGVFLTEASNDIHGAAGLALMAIAAASADQWVSVKLPNFDRSKQDPTGYLMKLAKAQIDMSTTIAWSANEMPSLGRARVDWLTDIEDTAETHRIAAENVED